MNIKEELQKLDSIDNFDIESINVIKQIKFDQEELTKKLHIVKAVIFANKLEQAVSTDFFSKMGIRYLQLNRAYTDNEGDVLRFYLLDKNNQGLFAHYDAHENEQTRAVYAMIEELHPFEPENLNLKLFSSTLVSAELSPGVKEKILDLLLSTELKGEYEYNKMQGELPSNNTNINNKRLKV